MDLEWRPAPEPQDGLLQWAILEPPGPNDWAPFLRWERLSSPAWDDFASAIQRLDGERYTQVLLRCRKEAAFGWWKPPELMIAGGATGRVLVEYWAPGHEANDWVVSRAVEPSRGDSQETQVVGSKPVTHPARCRVSHRITL